MSRLRGWAWKWKSLQVNVRPRLKSVKANLSAHLKRDGSFMRIFIGEPTRCDIRPYSPHRFSFPIKDYKRLLSCSMIRELPAVTLYFFLNSFLQGFLTKKVEQRAKLLTEITSWRLQLLKLSKFIKKIFQIMGNYSYINVLNISGRIVFSKWNSRKHNNEIIVIFCKNM